MLSKSITHTKTKRGKNLEQKLQASTINNRQMSEERDIPKEHLEEKTRSPREAYELVHSESFFDANPRLNMASFVTTWMEPEAERIIQENLSKNFIDKPIYPRVIDVQDRCVTMIANMLHASPNDFPTGTSTIGSSEAIHLAGLAMKWKWKKFWENKNMTPPGKPQLIMGTNVQVCWKKFTRYFEVEEILVDIDDNNRMDLSQVKEKLNECTIGVVGILGNTYSGEFDDINQLNDIVEEYNTQQNSWNIPIHVDAASGGFVAPFAEELKHIVWDFQLNNVRSINLSGHKYGLVYPGLGWAIWRDKNDIDKDLIFEISYLGESQEDFGLNFSRGASNVYAQYYNFVRLGITGYSQVMNQLMHIYHQIKNYIPAIIINEEQVFDLVSHDNGLPLVCIKLKQETKYAQIEHEPLKTIAYKMKERGWVLPVYPMAKPKQKETVMRMVIKDGFNEDMAQKLMEDLQWATKEILTPKHHQEKELLCTEAMHC
ncbi:MAG: glutamate decarboxylase [Marinifilaceae bacterium]